MGGVRLSTVGVQAQICVRSVHAAIFVQFADARYDTSIDAPVPVPESKSLSAISRDVAGSPNTGGMPPGRTHGTPRAVVHGTDRSVAGLLSELEARNSGAGTA